jgi:signal peptidase II
LVSSTAETTPDAGAPDPHAAPTATVAGAEPSLRLFWWLSLGIVALDQITKGLIRADLPLYSSRTVIAGMVDLVHVRNAGVAFGILNDVTHPLRNVLTTVLAVAALIGIAYYARHIRREERMARLGLSLILGGAIGNLADRIRQGFVVDFVDVYWHDRHFWAFNVADAAITIGAVLIFLELLRPNRHASHPV